MPKASVMARPLVLVVDDDPELRMLAGLQLGEGFDVIQAADGKECVELAASRTPDVILLDMMMPGMSGREVLTALSELEATADIPVVFLSALSGVDVRVEAIESGAADYIVKPHDPRELVARVGAAVRLGSRESKQSFGHDEATGLPDRQQFEARLKEEVARAKRSQVPLGMLLITVDNLEALAERFGRDQADELLKQVAGALRIELRTADSLFHYGPDEFAAILPNTEVGTAYLAAERLRTAIREVKHEGHPVSVSVGVSEFSEHKSADEMIASAEIALFRAQESGGDLSWRADDPRKHSLNPVALSEDLTDREWDVLAHLMQRRTEQEIARRLEISPGTVRSHKARIRRKLHIPPDMRLGDFVKANFGNLVSRLPERRRPSSDDTA